MVNSSKDGSANSGDASPADVPTSDSKTYSAGEKVLAYHGPRIYEAKVQKAEIRKNEWRYFVHYLGWNKNWDEWVGESRLMKHTEENVKKQTALDKKQGADKNVKSGRSTQAKAKSSTDTKVDKEDIKSNVSKGKKRKNDSGVEKQNIITNSAVSKGKKQKNDSGVERQNIIINSEVSKGKKRKNDSVVERPNIVINSEVSKGKKQKNDSGVEKQNIITKSAVSKGKKPKNDSGVEKQNIITKSAVSKGKKPKNDSGVEKGNGNADKLFKIQIPAPLKKQLFDDWDFVNQQDKLVKLPRSPTVDEIMTKYLDYKSKKDTGTADSTGEVLKGIRCYFDKALPMMLLYKKERKQCSEAVEDNASPSTIYGAEHLLRLFVKLPELLAYVNIDEETLNCLQQKLLDFLKFLQKNQSTFFLSAYDATKVSEGKGKGKDE